MILSRHPLLDFHAKLRSQFFGNLLPVDDLGFMFGTSRERIWKCQTIKTCLSSNLKLFCEFMALFESSRLKDRFLGALEMCSNFVDADRLISENIFIKLRDDDDVLQNIIEGLSMQTNNILTLLISHFVEFTSPRVFDVLREKSWEKLEKKYFQISTSDISDNESQNRERP